MQTSSKLATTFLTRCKHLSHQMVPAPNQSIHASSNPPNDVIEHHHSVFGRRLKVEFEEQGRCLSRDRILVGLS